jgi:heptosyltransferase-2
MNLPMAGDDAGRWLRLDCLHFRGDRPCATGIQGVCPENCTSYDAMGQRILLIKLGALGDVIRTAALLPGLKAKWPHSHISWVTRPAGTRMLAHHPLIDRLLAFDAETICHLEHERFDLCLSLDKEPGPTALAMRIDTPDRRGIGLSAFGTPFPLNAEATHYFRLGIDNRLKFQHNRKSYQQLLYEALALDYTGERYRVYPSRADEARAAACWQRLGISAGEVVIGFNTGAGAAFAHKNWPAEKYIALAEQIVARHGWRVALLGGPDERETNERIMAACAGVVDTGTTHRELEFAALVRRCNVVVTGDTMAMHVAIAGNVPVVVLFGPTCAAEIDLYGRGEQVLTSLTCAPCYRRTCDYAPNCMDDIPVDRVLGAVQRWVACPVQADDSRFLAEVPA